ncbi:MAG: hypothetical protein AAB705_00505 [Patescibacteria group bacterium]
MVENNITQKISRQAIRLERGFNQVDPEILKETEELVWNIFKNTHLTLPNKKIKFLLLSSNKKVFLSRIAKLGHRFLTQ